MKKLTLTALFLGTGAGVFGCAQKELPQEAPEIDSLLTRAWQRYGQGLYDEALATFDSVIVVDAYNSEAYLGEGYSQIQLSSYSDAYGSFSILNILENVTDMVDTFAVDTLDTTALGTIIDTSWYHTVTVGDYGVWRYRLTYPGSLVGVTSFLHGKLEVQIVGFDDQYAYISSQLPLIVNDTGVDSTESFTFYYRYSHGNSLPEIVWYGYAGAAIAYFVEGNDLTSAYKNGYSALVSYANMNHDAPDRVKNNIPMDSSRLYYQLAYIMFKDEKRANAVDILHRMDPSFPYAGWSMSTAADFAWCFDPDNYLTILERIEQGIFGGS